MIRIIIKWLKKLGIWKEAIQIFLIKYKLEKEEKRERRESNQNTNARKRNRRVWNEKQEKRNRLLK